MAHPVVVRHPLSGREALFVNPSFTIRFEGMSIASSAPLLARIYSHVLRSVSVARFRWDSGSVAIWDNRATWHNSKNDYRGERRARCTASPSTVAPSNRPDPGPRSLAGSTPRETVRRILDQFTQTAPGEVVRTLSHPPRQPDRADSVRP